MVDALQKYKNTRSYATLLEKHNLTDSGVWEVLGEDPNCDWGGSHHQPRLGTYTGKLEDVLEMAVDMPNFWSWGAGGDIRKLEISTVESGVKRSQVKQALEKLSAKDKALLGLSNNPDDYI